MAIDWSQVPIPYPIYHKLTNPKIFAYFLSILQGSPESLTAKIEVHRVSIFRLNGIASQCWASVRVVRHIADTLHICPFLSGCLRGRGRGRGCLIIGGSSFVLQCFQNLEDFSAHADITWILIAWKFGHSDVVVVYANRIVAGQICRVFWYNLKRDMSVMVL